MTLTEPAQTSSAEASPGGSTLAPGDREMTMLEHLEELRQRLVVSVTAIVVGLIVTLIPIPGADSLTHFVIETLAKSAPNGVLVTLRPGEGFFAYVQVSLLLGVALAMPVIVYQVLAFVMPALHPHERRYLYLAVPGVTISFVAGAAFCYALLLPVAIRFLGGFAADIFNPQWTAEYYLDFVSTFLFWMGLVFELPVVMFFLSKLGVVSATRMARFRRYALVMAFVMGAIITPTPDPINQTIVSVPIYLLFELGIILARFA
jgi:sec-independent protein translocase protein TatC